MTQAYSAPPMEEEIAALLDRKAHDQAPAPEALDVGLVVDATVHAVDEDFVYVQLDEQHFGRCIVGDAALPGTTGLPEIGTTVRCFLDEQMDDTTWTVSLAKAVMIDAFDVVAGWKRNKTRVRGRVNLVTRGGFAVEVHGLRAFLPNRESGIPRHESFDAVGKVFEFDVIRFEKRDAQPVLSRKALAAEEQKGSRSRRMQELEVGQVIQGVVTTVRPFGVFVDLGEVEGLCHVSELGLAHAADPSSAFAAGDSIQVSITDIDLERGRIALSRRDSVDEAVRQQIAGLEVGSTLEGTVTRIADFGAFVEVAPGLEGLLHVSELSWTERHAHVADAVAVGDTLRLKVLAAEAESGRISLSLRALSPNPWAEIQGGPGAGAVVEGTITRIESYGLFVRLENGIEGLCHISDLTWTGRPAHPSEVQDFQVGQALQVRVLSVEPERGRVSLGLKQVEDDPWEGAPERTVEGAIFRAPVVRMDERAAFVEVAPKLEGRLHISQISEERVDSVRAALRIGQEIEVMVTNADRARRRLDVSIRALKEKLEADTPRSFSDDVGEMNPLGEALRKGGVLPDNS